MSKLQKKSSALKRGHPTLQNMNFYQFFSTFGGHFCPPGSGSGSTGPIESGSETLIKRIMLKGTVWIVFISFALRVQDYNYNFVLILNIFNLREFLLYHPFYMCNTQLAIFCKVLLSLRAASYTVEQQLEECWDSLFSSLLPFKIWKNRFFCILVTSDFGADQDLLVKGRDPYQYVTDPELWYAIFHFTDVTQMVVVLCMYNASVRAARVRILESIDLWTRSFFHHVFEKRLVV